MNSEIYAMIVVKIGGKIMFNNVYPREKYLKKIRPFYDSDIIKVITALEGVEYHLF